MIYSGNNFIIRAWQKGDESFLAHSANNKNIWNYLDNKFPYPYTYDDAIYFIDNTLKSDANINFAMVIDDEPLGNIEILKGKGIYINSVRIKFWLSEEYWGQGIMSEALGWLVEYCFNNYAINRITALVFSNNKAAQRVLVKNGFTHEATLTKAILKNGEVYDEFVFSLLK